MIQNLMTLRHAAKRLGVSPKTLRRWEQTGRIRAIRTPTGYRRFLESEINHLAGIKIDEPKNLPVAAYCRVSSHEQKTKGDLERQQGRVLNYCIEKGYQVLKSYAEVGSGMNDNRPMLRALFRLVVAKQISRVIVEHKDRLTVNRVLGVGGRV